jgi:hypothetical protein
MIELRKRVPHGSAITGRSGKRYREPMGFSLVGVLLS